MKIAISAMGPSLDADVEPRFGRCQYFVIVDPQTMEFEAVENANIVASSGAGVATAQMIASKGAQVVLTGNCGPNAHQSLAAAGIQLITGVSGRIRDAIEGYKARRFQPASQPTVDAHSGMGGMGTGSGMGRGMGRGMGMGRGIGAGITSPAVSGTPSASPAQELEVLKAQSQVLVQQLSEIQHRIEELERQRNLGS